MIYITRAGNNIEFLTRDRRSRSKDQTFDLLYAVSCNTCNNVILAAFKTDKKIDLWNYEETSILYTREGQNKGQFSHYFPTVESQKGDSCYESTFTMTGKDNYQTIRLKNHILNPDRIGKEVVDKYEVGERPCVTVAVASLRKDLSVKTALAMCIRENSQGSGLDNLDTFHWSSQTNRIANDIRANGFVEAPTYGPIPIYSIIIPKEKITYGHSLWDSRKYTTILKEV